MNLTHSATATPPSQSLLSIQPTGLKSDYVDQVPDMSVDWKWYLEYVLMNLAGWLLLFGTLLLLTYYMQEGAILYIEQ